VNQRDFGFTKLIQYKLSYSTS